MEQPYRADVTETENDNCQAETRQCIGWAEERLGLHLPRLHSLGDDGHLKVAPVLHANLHALMQEDVMHAAGGR